MKKIQLLVFWFLIPLCISSCFPPGIFLAIVDIRWWYDPSWYPYAHMYSSPTKFPIAWILLGFAGLNMVFLVIHFKQNKRDRPLETYQNKNSFERLVWYIFRGVLLISSLVFGLIVAIFLVYIGLNGPN